MQHSEKLLTFYAKYMENINKSTTHFIFMWRCFELALLGKKSVAPNPTVGAVLVYEDKIISEGYHEFFGGPHAEINCLNNIPPTYLQPNFLNKVTLYVSLEPCCHHGKTPPCTQAIIKAGIKKVVIACADKNKLVAQKGIQELRQAGIEVVFPLLEEDAHELIKPFLHFHTHQKPYVILKWAESKNGAIAKNNFEQVQISSPHTNFVTHQWRSEVQAIMIGTNTAYYDNPLLSTRHAKGKSPSIIVLDRQLRIPHTHHIFQDTTRRIYVINEVHSETQGNQFFVKMNFDDTLLNKVLSFLYEQQITSLLVEGGAKLLNAFLEQKLWQEVRRIKSNTVIIEKGLPAPFFQQQHHHEKRIGNDHITWHKNI